MELNIEFLQAVLTAAFGNIGRSAFIVCLGFLVSRIIRAAIRKAFASNATIARLLSDLVKYVTYLVVIIAVLHVFFGNTVQSFLTVAGAGGIALGFGAQSLIRDLFSGFFLLLDGQLAVGDYVTIGDNSGIVEDIGLRVTNIRCESGDLVIVPNGEIRVIVKQSR
jgi:small conductance mechanosensitive channel